MQHAGLPFSFILLATMNVLSVCAPKPSVEPSLQMSLQPSPLRAGTALISVRGRDANDRPVTDPRMTVITGRPATRMRGEMAMPGMGKPSQTIVAHNEGYGMYRAAVVINEATLWHIVVHANSPQGYATQQIVERAR